MAKYQKYTEYKDSGVEWLEKIPSHWKASYVGVVSDVIDPQPDHRAPAISENGDGFPYIGIRDVNKDGTLNFETARPVEESAVIKQEQSFTIEPHNIIFCKVGTLGLPRKIIPHGRCALSATLVLIKARKIESQFLLYALDSDCIISQTNFVATGSTRAALGIQQIRKFRIPLPPNSEQVAIACFLDHETAQIDTLIAKQEKLIELLKEKRQAVISHAVTKGLNPNVQMKDSGVEWLGEVPEHWKLVPLKYLCSFSGGGTPTKDNLTYWTNGNIPWVSPKDMKTFLIKETQDYITEKAVKESSTNMVEPNSLLIVVRSGILQRTIPIAINIVPVTMNQDMKALKFGQRILVEYVANLIHGNTQQLLLEWSKEGATVESIEHEYLANSITPVPPIEEQEEIIQHIDNELKLFKQLENNANKAIQLMQERRTALISAAVTGKIDVRHHASRIMGNDKMQTEVV
ncbi:TPA: restriction endonuclease subunit S [Acinetobacter baumannii]|uniref:restriction endonuclease subunit S n=1 Tax=Acinetobacter baumannii TaxID=470 RepID=UPI0002885584|nr:restriction endonuclease subunit S [Acinetobacter baumannii]EKU7311870.1 restriction endonuclease subunit S [Acinetobacter baumannii]EXG91603.1 type I restriction modification DNA specificity domain protein [Acinetobacter baumannii 1062314]MBJ9416389.1 restriction endonuclease subunit S [Acinetobacter baumannii]MDC5435546.1 restriction endonuclease subunit S [Acinetobacter baumannii]MDN8292379.1 restriction endonuclease subunit S [Acinetobacter baumannii]